VEGWSSLQCLQYRSNTEITSAEQTSYIFTSISQPTNAHIISNKTLLKRFKTLRHVSILSDHHQGALFLAKLYYGIHNSIISHKTHLKHFKTLRHVSMLSDHHQGALLLAKFILRYSQFNSYLQTSCCGSISCCVVEQWLGVRRTTHT